MFDKVLRLYLAIFFVNRKYNISTRVSSFFERAFEFLLPVMLGIKRSIFYSVYLWYVTLIIFLYLKYYPTQIIINIFGIKIQGITFLILFSWLYYFLLNISLNKNVLIIKNKILYIIFNILILYLVGCFGISIFVKNNYLLSNYLFTILIK